MEIDCDSFFRIFRNNFYFEVVDTIVGKAIKMNSYEAFLYSTITGAVYLDNIFYPFTPKGLTKIFNSYKDYKMISGLFEGDKIKNSPYFLNLKKPFLFDNDKFIIPVEFKDESEYLKQLKFLYNTIKDTGLKTTDFLLQRIESNKKGNGMEPLMEYIACMEFKNRGYIVENQTPLTFNLGSPDFIAWSSSQFSGEGLFLVELMMLRLFPSKIKKVESLLGFNIDNIIVGEAKTSTLTMKKQISKYVKSGLFNEAYEIHPFKQASASPYSLITFNNIFDMKVKHVVSNEKEIVNNIDREDYLTWLQNYFKTHLLSNFSNEEINELSLDFQGKVVKSQNDIITLIKELSCEGLIKILRKYLNKVRENNGIVK